MVLESVMFYAFWFADVVLSCSDFYLKFIGFYSSSVLEYLYPLYCTGSSSRLTTWF